MGGGAAGRGLGGHGTPPHSDSAWGSGELGMEWGTGSVARGKAGCSVMLLWWGVKGAQLKQKLFHSPSLLPYQVHSRALPSRFPLGCLPHRCPVKEGRKEGTNVPTSRLTPLAALPSPPLLFPSPPLPLALAKK